MIFERENNIDELENNLTGAPIDASNTEDLAVAEEPNSDEATTSVAKSSNDMEIDLKEEHQTGDYKEKMNIYNENTDKIENRHKHYTKKWRTIYKVIQQDFFDETEIFQIIFKNSARIMQMKLIIYCLMSKITRGK